MSATRDNKNKLEMSHFFEGMSKAREGMVLRSVLGAKNHGRLNWRSSIDDPAEREIWIQKCKDSLSRHYWDFMDGKVLDEDGLTNLSGILWNVAVLMEYDA